VQVVISTAILLIATIIAASVFTAAAISELYTFQNTFKEVGSKNQAAYESSITIIGETNATSPNRIIVWVKNIGATSFPLTGADGDPQYWDVFISFPNGVDSRFPYSNLTGCSSTQDGNCFNVALLNDISGTGIWDSGETIQLTIYTSQTISAGSYQVSLSLSNGVTAQDSFSF